MARKAKVAAPAVTEAPPATGAPDAPAVTEAPAPVLTIVPLPARITMAERAFYEIGTSGVHRDLVPGTVVTNPDIIKEVIAHGAGFY